LIGSALYSLGGFTLPFVFVGSFATVMSFILCLVIPNIKADPDKEKDSYKKLASIYDLLKVNDYFFTRNVRLVNSCISRKVGKLRR
jgi:hypothetical protein